MMDPFHRYGKPVDLLDGGPCFFLAVCLSRVCVCVRVYVCDFTSFPISSSTSLSLKQWVSHPQSAFHYFYYHSSPLNRLLGFFFVVVYLFLAAPLAFHACYFHVFLCAISRVDACLCLCVCVCVCVN